MISLPNILTLIFAYLLGSIPSAVWVGQIFYKIDVREYGSGNAGATNTFRVLGYKAGIPVLLFDIFKGWASVAIIVVVLKKFNFVQFGSQEYGNIQLGSGIACLMGHIFPIYAGFRGGKGVATLLGFMIAIHPASTGVCIVIFIITLIIFRYVSLSSMIAGFSFPFLLLYAFDNVNEIQNLFSILIATLILVTHQKNIERLFRGAEPKVKFSKRK